MAWKGLVARYGERMAIDGVDSPVSLCEGNTPLIPAPAVSEWLGGANVFLKYEGLNPTGSFKDRGMTAAVTHAKAHGVEAVICASTGNTSASAAAYAARAGMKCYILVPAGKVALGKLAGSLAYGGQVIEIDGSFDRALELVQELSSKYPIELVNSLNPARLEGQKTAAWEVCEQLGEIPDWLSLPVGNAGNISAYWLGFQECERGICTHFCNKKCEVLPKLFGTQASGSAPIVTGKKVDHPETKATAIRIGNPARWQQALTALDQSGGQITSATDEQIYEAYGFLARNEGVFCEPSSAASVAGLRKATQNGLNLKGQTVVCVLTGHGLKDPDSAFEISMPIISSEGRIEALAKALDL